MTERELLQHDWEKLECFPWGKEDLKSLKTSLNLPVCGELGSTITWKSSKSDVITDMGRVIRPSFLDKNETLTLTAVLEYGNQLLEKVFPVTVIADETFVDPQYLNDKEFFEEFEYSIPHMKSIRECVDKRNYKSAKDALLQYYKSRDNMETLEEQPCNIGMCYMMANGFSTLQRSDRFYKGEGATDSTEYERLVIPIQLQGIENGVTVTYDINSKYNECVGLCIAGNRYFNDSMRPCLEITTKKETTRHECIDSALLRSGRYKDEPLGNPEELYVKTFGAFLGDDTYHSILKFHVVGLESEIISVNLVLYVKKDLSLLGDKEFYVVLFPENIWDGESATWSKFKWQFSNRNGIPETDSYNIQEEFDFEYSFQRVRFMHFKWIAQAYHQTKDEKFLYYMIKTMVDFIKMQGYPRTYIREAHVGSGWANDKVKRTLCGGWPRGLDAAIRIESFSEVFNVIAKSKYMTPDCFSTILKYVCDSCDGVAFKSVTEPVSNLRQFEIVGMFKMALCIPEFKKQKEWIRKTQEVMEQMMLTVTLEDGTYRETTGGYNFAVFANYINFKRQCMENNIELSSEFDERLQKFAVYNSLLQGPNGESLQYGDQNAEKIANSYYIEIADWYKNEELRYLLTHGKKGSKPAWTSYHFPVSSASMLRSDWNNDATYIWIQARGGGAHGHQDDNHITIIADERVLLTDAGIFTYTADDPFRIWGTSSAAHNTVTINDLNQAYGKEGYTEQFISNDVFDKITLVSTRYEGFKFARTVLFMKPDIIFIEDVIIPENTETENIYKQMWHMLPTANISFDVNKRMMQSNFKKGSNIYIYSLDENVTLRKDVGWYDYGYQQLAENSYGYFIKENVKGEVKFHTVLKIVRSE